MKTHLNRIRFLVGALLCTSNHAKKSLRSMKKSKQKTSTSYTTQWTPIAQCQGGCSQDSDCETGLACFHHTGYEVVPGCQWLVEGYLGYCYNPADDVTNPPTFPPPIVTPTPAPTTPPTRGAPMSETSTTTPVPTSSSFSFTTITNQELSLVGGMDGEPSSAFPLKKCQGHCWGDVDCEEDLVCFQMFEPGPVPGCEGEGEPDRGYCFNVADYPPNGQGDGPGFRLKLYWEEGYLWQDETFERPWCMECDTYCVVNHCSLETVSRFEFVPNENGTQIKLKRTDMCLQQVRNQDIVIMPCKADDSSQWFVGDFDNYRFEIHPYGMPNGCLTQNHHPRALEVIYVEDCAVCRADTTNYWNIY